jgi:hypothetical protein
MIFAKLLLSVVWTLTQRLLNVVPSLGYQHLAHFVLPNDPLSLLAQECHHQKVLQSGQLVH